MPITLLKSATFNGFESSISPGYTLLNSDGSVFQARTVSGIVGPLLGQNTYMALMALPDTCMIAWDDGNSPANYGFEPFNNNSSVVQVVIVNDNLQT